MRSHLSPLPLAGEHNNSLENKEAWKTPLQSLSFFQRFFRAVQLFPTPLVTSNLQCKYLINCLVSGKQNSRQHPACKKPRGTNSWGCCGRGCLSAVYPIFHSHNPQSLATMASGGQCLGPLTLLTSSVCTRYCFLWRVPWPVVLPSQGTLCPWSVCVGGSQGIALEAMAA